MNSENRELEPDNRPGTMWLKVHLSIDRIHVISCGPPQHTPHPAISKEVIAAGGVSKRMTGRPIEQR